MWEDTGGPGRLVIDSPAKAFHLARRENSLATGHVSTLVDNEYDRTQACVDISTGGDKG